MAALSPSYASFTTFRALQGLVNKTPQVVGLSVVHDMQIYVTPAFTPVPSDQVL